MTTRASLGSLHSCTTCPGQQPSLLLLLGQSGLWWVKEEALMTWFWESLYTLCQVCACWTDDGQGPEPEDLVQNQLISCAKAILYAALGAERFITEIPVRGPVAASIVSASTAHMWQGRERAGAEDCKNDVQCGSFKLRERRWEFGKKMVRFFVTVVTLLFLQPLEILFYEQTFLIIIVSAGGYRQQRNNDKLFETAVDYVFYLIRCVWKEVLNHLFVVTVF